MRLSRETNKLLKKRKKLIIRKFRVKSMILIFNKMTNKKSSTKPKMIMNLKQT